MAAWPRTQLWWALCLPAACPRPQLPPPDRPERVGGQSSGLQTLVLGKVDAGTHTPMQPEAFGREMVGDRARAGGEGCPACAQISSHTENPSTHRDTWTHGPIKIKLTQAHAQAQGCLLAQ